MFFKHNYKAILWALFILAVCSIPGRDLPDISSWWSFPGIDKAVHIFLYFVFSLLLVSGFKKQFTFNILQTHSFISSICVCMAYGLLIEIFQATIFIDRSAELKDLLANTAGAALGAIYSFVFTSKK